MMKTSTKLMAAAAVLTAVGANAQTTFKASEFTFPATHRTTPLVADFNNNGKLDIQYNGQLDGDLDKPGVWVWTQISTLVYNLGNDEWNVDKLTAVQNDEPNEDGSYNYHIAGTKHGIRLSSFNHNAAIDYNNDGLMDILVCGKDDTDDWFSPDEMKVNHLSLFRNNGDGTFTLVEEAAFPIIYPDGDGRGFAIAVGDYDRDGFTDFMVCANLQEHESNYPGRACNLYRNLGGTGEFADMKIANTKGGVWTSEIKDEDSGDVITPKVQLEGWFQPMSGNVHMADVNNDGWLDIVTVGWADNVADENHPNAGNYCRVYLNKEGKSFEDVTPASPLFYTLRSSSSNLADLDGDGYLDLFMTGWGDNGIEWNAYTFLNTTDESSLFDDPISANDQGLDGTENSKTYISDFDGDGCLDIFYGGIDSKAVIYYGTPSGVFSRHNHDEAVTGGNYPAVGDINGDGLLDIVHSGWGEDNYVKLYYNDGDAVEAPSAPATVSAKVEDGVLYIEWTDEDGTETTAYNVIVKYGDKEFAILPANIETGFIKLADKSCALRHNQRSYTMVAPEGDLTVGVQALNTYNEAYSQFTICKVSSTGVESIGTAKVGVRVSADAVTVDGEGQVEIFNVLGQRVAAGQAGQTIPVGANGVLLVKAAGQTVKIVK